MALVGLVFLMAVLLHGMAGASLWIGLSGLISAGLGFLASRRRLLDAQRPVAAAAINAAAWGLFSLAMFASGGANWSWWLLIPVMASIVAFSMLPSQTRQSTREGGVWGYQGPMSRPAQPRRNYRVEPSLDGESGEQDYTPYDSHDSQQDDWQPSAAVKIDWGQWTAKLRPLLVRYARPLAAVSAVLVLSLVGIRWYSGLPSAEVEANSAVVAEPLAAPSFEHSVSMPDNYELLLNQDGLIVAWPGDMAPEGELWSLLTAQGERRCRVARFNNGTEYRPVKVEVWKDGVHYAYFSPLDTADMVFDVAMRGNFSLCGYTFGLSGSMDQLRGHPAFALYTRKR
ncbi:hypothetical protein SAMN02745129_1144 [Ferrimonas marina]|uniref:Uncharacterized protein n=2 Tax=Ferrimonas marina TaxID=299255 RepID=A0A1M5NQN8_9GAMM|nr:hypothetical protein SAMN02745129_1144 [Ferrimonas marina]